jgi:hypothetical protein
MGSHGAIVHRAKVLLQTLKSCAHAVALKTDAMPEAIAIERKKANLVFIQ